MYEGDSAVLSRASAECAKAVVSWRARWSPWRARRSPQRARRSPRRARRSPRRARRSSQRARRLRGNVESAKVTVESAKVTAESAKVIAKSAKVVKLLSPLPRASRGLINACPPSRSSRVTIAEAVATSVRVNRSLSSRARPSRISVYSSRSSRWEFRRACVALARSSWTSKRG